MSDDRPMWERDGHDWPHRGASRFVAAAGLRWHVQAMGPADAPVVLLVHGAGSATHSWRGLMPLLADRFRVVAPDLPGHGFTDPLPAERLSLPGMATALAELLAELEVAPAIAVGHSAGAALLARACLDGGLSPGLLVALNGALRPAANLGARLFPNLARTLLLNPMAPRLVAWAADQVVVQRLLQGTGSRLDAQGLELYRRLFGKPAHVAGTLGMLANGSLDALDPDLPRLTPRTLLVVGSRDRVIAPGTADAVRARLPDAGIVHLDGLGHLAHEEAPGRVAAVIEAEIAARGLVIETAPV